MVIVKGLEKPGQHIPFRSLPRAFTQFTIREFSIKATPKTIWMWKKIGFSSSKVDFPYFAD